MYLKKYNLSVVWSLTPCETRIFVMITSGERLSSVESLCFRAIPLILFPCSQEDKSRVDLFKEYARSKGESVWMQLLNLLNRPVNFIMNMTSRVIAKMACWSRDLMTGADLQFYLTWLKDQLRATGNDYIQSVVRCMQMMLRIDDYR